MDEKEVVTTEEKEVKVKPMVIINDMFRVAVDDMNMTLLKKGIAKDGGETWTQEGYFGTWEGLLNNVHKLLVNQRIAKKVQIELSELRVIFLEVEKEIRDWFKVNIK